MIFSRRKRLAALLLALLLLAGCGVKEEAPVTEAPTETAVEATAPVETTLPEETTVPTEPTLPPVVYETGQTHGAEVFFHNGTSFPVALGYPLLSDEEIDALIAEKDYAKMAGTITTLPDAVRLYERMGIRLDRQLRDPGDGKITHSRSAWQVLDSGVSTWAGMNSLTHYLLADNFDDMGYVHMQLGQNSGCMSYNYVHHNGRYYLIYSPNYVETHPEDGWFAGFDEDVICSAEDFQTIADSLAAGADFGVPIEEIYLIRSAGDATWGRLEVGKNYTALFPVGTEVTAYRGEFEYFKASLDWKSQTRMEDVAEKWADVEVFSYVTTTFPVGLGQPQLSDEQIDALIAEADYEKTAQTIVTLPDAVNYFLRSGIRYELQFVHNMINGFNYHKSAWQVMKDGYGQCVDLSNLMHYLLLDDYDEIGYVAVSTNQLSHVMIYILEDGYYYLIDPSQYGTPTPSLWNGYCSEDFMDIADELTESFVLAGSSTPVSTVRTVKMPGDFVASSASDKVPTYPEGTEVTVYHGPEESLFRDPDYEWDTHTRMNN